jgi:hypothetical protein
MVGPPPPPSHGVFGSAPAAPRPPRQLLGFDDHALELLLAEFHYLEQVGHRQAVCHLGQP